MYLILIKYFYYFYFFKKNKKFKFFILLDLIFFLMKKYFKVLILKKKLNKYKRFYALKLNKFKLLFKRIKFKNSKILIKINRKIKLFYNLHNLIDLKIKEFNDFIIEFLPTQLLPLGNRKKFYNLINKRFKRFFYLIKKKLNKKFFFYYLVTMFKKLKFLFFKSDPFLNKKNFLFEFFSNFFLENSYNNLFKLYKNENSFHSNKYNKLTFFFNLIKFFSRRIDFYLFKNLSFFSLNDIRNKLRNGIFSINNHTVKDFIYLNNYDLISINSFDFLNHKKNHIYNLNFFFNNSNSFNYHHYYNLKKLYYNILFKKLKEKVKKIKYLSLSSNKIKLFSKNVLNNYYFYKNNYLINSNFKNNFISFDILIENIFKFLSSYKINDFYIYDNLEKIQNEKQIKKEFPFFYTTQKDEFKLNNYKFISNINFNFSTSIIFKENKLLDYRNFINFLNLYFFLYKFKDLYFINLKNKFIVSHNTINNINKENKKLFYYFSMFYQVNIFQFI